MKNAAVILMVFAAVQVFAQPSGVLNKLRNYNVLQTDITLNTQPFGHMYAFDIMFETTHEQSPVIYTATYDPSQSPAWNMTGWNDKTPDKPQANILRIRVERCATEPVKIDEKTLKAEQFGDYLIVSFRLDPSTVPAEYMYLKDCDGQAHINTVSGKLEKTIWENFQPTKSQSLHLSKIREEVYFEFVDGSYHVAKELQYIGETVKTPSGNVSGTPNQAITYSNYRKL
jgi:hypothetical protein